MQMGFGHKKPLNHLRGYKSKHLHKFNPKAQDYRRFLNILISPHTGEYLFEKGGRLLTGSGRAYQIVNNIPVMVLQQEEMHIVPPVSGKISRTTEKYTVPKEYSAAKTILHLGSGNVECVDPRVISLDILPMDNVDIVSEAEVLPFASNSFDLVESRAVFEHVYDPLAAIKEVRRVLKPGGVFRIDNSFFQPYHGFPGNYFDMTPQANETYLVDDFIMQESSIPKLGTPLMSLSMAIDRFLINLDAMQKKEVLRMSLARFHALIKSDFTIKNRLMKDFSEYEKRAMAATHLLVAKKPKNYEKKLAKINKNSENTESWIRQKREYYTLRTEIMLRYHEVFAYKRFTLDLDPHCKFNGIKFPNSLEKILTPLLLDDPFNRKELSQKIEAMRHQETLLVSLRDAIITIFLERKDRATVR